MKPLRWTLHALAALDDRGIDRAEEDQTIAEPELSALDPPRRVVLMPLAQIRRRNRQGAVR